MEDDLKILKVEILSKHLLDHALILKMNKPYFTKEYNLQ